MTTTQTAWLASCTVCGASEHTTTHDQAAAWTMQHVDDCPDCACEVRPTQPGWWAQFSESAQLADVAPPAGSIHIDDWHDTGRESCGRCFTGTSRPVDVGDRTLHVDIDGVQRPDGSTERVIAVLDGHTTPPTQLLDALTAGQARQLARALIAASDEATEHDDDRSSRSPNGLAFIVEGDQRAEEYNRVAR